MEELDIFEQLDDAAEEKNMELEIIKKINKYTEQSEYRKKKERELNEIIERLEEVLYSDDEKLDEPYVLRFYDRSFNTNISGYLYSYITTPREDMLRKFLNLQIKKSRTFKETMLPKEKLTLHGLHISEQISEDGIGIIERNRLELKRKEIEIIKATDFPKAHQMGRISFDYDTKSVYVNTDLQSALLCIGYGGDRESVSDIFKTIEELKNNYIGDFL